LERYNIPDESGLSAYGCNNAAVCEPKDPSAKTHPPIRWAFNSSAASTSEICG